MRRLRLPQAGIAMSLVALLWSARAQDSTAPSVMAQPANPSLSTAYKGSGSCSAVACHGGIAPLAGSTVLRNEHTTWISDDRHSRAFQVLFEDRSKRIASNMARGKKPVPAHEDTRCLACHTTPRPESLLTATVWMNQDGVGCESCHGSAEKWLGIHTTGPRWSLIAPNGKQNDYGFMDTKDLVRRIEICAGCHVGQDARDGFPLRDVNHDLIAAGHPRLNFEFAAYQENQPKHWKTDKPESAEATADFPARSWRSASSSRPGRRWNSSAVGPLVLPPWRRRRCHPPCRGPCRLILRGRNLPSTAAIRAIIVWPTNPGAETAPRLVDRLACWRGAPGTIRSPPPSWIIPLLVTVPRSRNSSPHSSHWPTPCPARCLTPPL